MMYHIPGVLSPQDVARFREHLEQAEWVDGRVTTGAQGAQAVSYTHLTLPTICSV